MKDLPIIKIKLTEVELAPWNYKQDDDVLKVKLMNASEKNGYIDKIAIAKREEEPSQYEVVNGNHRVMAFRDKGIKEVQAINLGTLTKTHRMRVGAELNELRFPNDQTKLAELMVEIKADFGMEELVLTMPFGEDDFRGFDQTLETGSGDGSSGQSGPQDPGNAEDWVYFKLGDVKGSIPQSVYSLFQTCIAKIKTSGEDKLPKQLEYIFAEFIATYGAENDVSKA